MEKKDFKVTYSKYCIDSYQSEEQYSDWHAAYEFSVCSFSVEPPASTDFEWPWESDTDPSKDVIPDEMYCVWVRYGDGDSFGSSTGNGQIVGLFADIDKAHALAKSIADDTYSSKGSAGYPYWRGYFNTLESVEVDKIPRREKEAKYPKSYKPKK